MAISGVTQTLEHEKFEEATDTKPAVRVNIIDGGGAATSPATGTTSTVAVTDSSSTGLALNAGRKGATFVNEGSEDVYLKHGATASTTDYTVKLIPDAVWIIENSDYTGVVDVITSTGTATLRVTEMTA